MNIARTLSAFIISFLLSFSVVNAQAADLEGEKAFDPLRISYEKDEKIKMLEAEVKRLRLDLAQLQFATQGKITALEAENQLLRSTLQNVRDQVGGGGYAPTTM